MKEFIKLSELSISRKEHHSARVNVNDQYSSMQLMLKFG